MMTKETKQRVTVRVHKWEDGKGNYVPVLSIDSGKFVREIKLDDETLGRLMMREAVEADMVSRQHEGRKRALVYPKDRQQMEELASKVWRSNDEDAAPAKTVVAKITASKVEGKRKPETKTNAKAVNAKPVKAKIKKRKIASSGTKGGDAFASLMTKMGK